MSAAALPFESSSIIMNSHYLVISITRLISITQNLCISLVV